MDTCGKATNSFFCDRCKKDLIAQDINNKDNLETVDYHNHNERFSKTKPDSDRCVYRLIRGEYKGWYCNTLLDNGELYCEDHTKRITGSYDNEELYPKTGFCQAKIIFE